MRTERTHGTIPLYRCSEVFRPMHPIPMDSPFLPLDACVVLLLPENIDPNGKHLEYKDGQGAVFAKMAKVYKKGGLFGLFRSDNHVHAELKDAAGALLLTTTSYRGSVARECKVELHDPAGTLLGILYDAPFGADFELPDGTLLGRARRSQDLTSEPKEILHTYTDAAEQVVGTCDRRFPNQSDSLLDFLVGTSLWGMPVQWVTLTAPVTPMLRTFLFLFPALQHLRFSRNW